MEHLVILIYLKTKDRKNHDIANYRHNVAQNTKNIGRKQTQCIFRSTFKI